MTEEPKETPQEIRPVEGEPTDSYIQVRRSHLYLALIPIALVVGLGAGYLLWGQGTAAEPDQTAVPVVQVDTSQVARIDVDPGDDPALGPENAPITIIEFSDFNCPHCQRWHNDVSQALFDTYPDQIRFIYKDFPVVGGGQVGFLASQAANCAGDVGDYWEYHDALFSGDYALNSDGVDQAAVDLGFDLDLFKECMVEGRYAEEIRDDFEYGANLGISSTPTFFVNGIPLIGAQPLLSFMEVINGELSN